MRWLTTPLVLSVLLLTSCGIINNTAVAPTDEEVALKKPSIPIAKPVEYDPPEIVEVEIEPVKALYRVTAYCACERCCGEWALNRPKDDNGNPIVVGAGGVILLNGYSCASTLPFGTKVELDGYGIVEVQDRTANWIVDKYGENVLDIYIADHAEAWVFGEKYLEGVIVNDA